MRLTLRFASIEFAWRDGCEVDLALTYRSLTSEMCVL